MIFRLFTSFLFFFFRDPETIHRLAVVILRVAGLWPFSMFIRAITNIRNPILAQTVFGLSFENPVGLAGGFDKNGEAIPGLAALGFGFIEVGSVTRVPQLGNPRPRMFRFPKDDALINRMGFNNEGADAVARRLAHTSPRVPLGISLGKSKDAELKDAPADYRASFEALYEYGSYFAVNVSSPNTPGLRTLQDKDALIGICRALDGYRSAQAVQKPILVKVAPDLTNEAIDDLLSALSEAHIDGIIATNTTTGRVGLSTETAETGGMSGKPLRDRATAVIRYIHERAPLLPIVGVGGIFTAEDAYEKIRAGASLVQIYTGFIYGGPFSVRRINAGLAQLLKRDGFKNIADAVGTSPAV